jgi:hypothetical protein
VRSILIEDLRKRGLFWGNFHHGEREEHEGFGQECVLNAAFAPNTIRAQGPRFVHGVNYIAAP